MQTRSITALIALIVALGGASHLVDAQARVGSDSATRLTRLGRDLAYGTAEGLGFSLVDQYNKQPPQWGTGWSGYGKRAASNIGEFVIQESVTEGLAAAMNRPLDYKRCSCRGTGDRIAWALHAAFTDQMPNGTHPLAVPRIVGAYVGSFAQSTWRPQSGTHLRTTLVNGTSSLAIGALINLYYEFR